MCVRRIACEFKWSSESVFSMYMWSARLSWPHRRCLLAVTIDWSSLLDDTVAMFAGLPSIAGPRLYRRRLPPLQSSYRSYKSIILSHYPKLSSRYERGWWDRYYTRSAVKTIVHHWVPRFEPHCTSNHARILTRDILKLLIISPPSRN